MIDWNQIETVLLDLDGTLLDLNFDNHFWLDFVPQRYARRHGLEIDLAKKDLMAKYQAVAGTIDWYCVDYWSNELHLDIASLKAELKHLIQVHPYVEDFLRALRRQGKKVWLVTNAHQRSLSLKMGHTGLAHYFHHQICAHPFRAPKEDQRFWHRLMEFFPFDRQATLFIDDSLPVLRSAREFGIKHIIAAAKPDSRQPPKATEEFAALIDFRMILPDSPLSAQG